MRGSGVKRRVLHPLQNSIVNPLVNLTWGLGIAPPGDALLETIGRRTGRPRRTPMCDGLEGETFWQVAQRGRDSDYVRNIEANPRVQVRTASRREWRTGIAHILDDDDPRERQRILCGGNFWRRLCVRASRGMDVSPITVRIHLDPR